MTNSVHTTPAANISSALFTWSNLISFSRIFVAFPIIYLHYQNGLRPSWPVGILVGYGILSDYLDGYIARRTGCVSEWGKILDPIADKISAFLLFLYAVWAGLIPLWFLIVEGARDLFILGGSIYIQRQYGKVAMAVMSGKWSINALVAYWICAFFLPDAAGPQLFFMGLSLTLMTLSLFDYIHRFILIQKGMKFN